MNTLIARLVANELCFSLQVTSYPRVCSEQQTLLLFPGYVLGNTALCATPNLTFTNAAVPRVSPLSKAPYRPNISSAL